LFSDHRSLIVEDGTGLRIVKHEAMLQTGLRRCMDVPWLAPYNERFNQLDSIVIIRSPRRRD